MPWRELERFVADQPAAPAWLARATRAGLRVAPTLWLEAAAVGDPYAPGLLVGPPAELGEGALLVRASAGDQDGPRLAQPRRTERHEWRTRVAALLAELPVDEAGRRRGVVWVQRAPAGPASDVVCDGWDVDRRTPEGHSSSSTLGSDGESKLLGALFRACGADLPVEVELVDDDGAPRVLDVRAALAPPVRDPVLRRIDPARHLGGQDGGAWVAAALVEAGTSLGATLGLAPAGVVVALGEAAWLDESILARVVETWRLGAEVPRGLGRLAASLRRTGALLRLASVVAQAAATVDALGPELEAARTLPQMWAISVAAATAGLRAHLADALAMRLADDLVLGPRVARRLGRDRERVDGALAGLWTRLSKALRDEADGYVRRHDLARVEDVFLLRGCDLRVRDLIASVKRTARLRDRARRACLPMTGTRAGLEDRLLATPVDEPPAAAPGATDGTRGAVA